MSSSAPETARRAELREWLAKADEDAAAARLCLDAADPLLGVAAYHCQQAAAKLLKAGLIAEGVAFRRTHDLDELATLLLAARPAARATIAPIRPLTSWGFAFRYPIPGHEEPLPTPGEIAATLADLERLRAFLVA